MATNLPWFRVYTELLDDRKIAKIARETKHSRAEIIGVWVSLLALASQSPERGKLLIADGIRFELDDLADVTGLEPAAIDNILGYFQAFGMVEIVDGFYSIMNWDSRQFDSDSSTERVSSYRKRQKNNTQITNTETLQKRYSNGDVTPPDTDTDTDTDILINSGAQNFQIVWESETGKLVTAMQSFFEMVNEFERVGVTPEIYRQAIREQKRSNYAVNNPTSVKSWAIDMVKDKKAGKAKPGLTDELDALIAREQAKLEQK